MIKNYVSLLVIIACCAGLLCGCGEDMEPNTNQMDGISINDDGTATLTFQVSEALPDEAYTRAPFKCDTIIQKLSDSLIIETVIAPDYATKTRSITPLTNTTILTIAYSHTLNRYYKRELSNVTNGRFTINLIQGETYDLIFYAVNQRNSGWNDFSNYFSGTWTPGGRGNSQIAGAGASVIPANGETERDLIFYKYDNLSVSTGTQLPAIAMKHLFCKANLTLTAENGTLGAWEVVLSPQSYSNANNVDIARGKDPVTTWTGAGARKDIILKNIEKEKLFIPYTANEYIALKYNNVSIDGENYSTNTPTTLTPAQLFVRGTKYNITATVKKPSIPTNLSVAAYPQTVTLLRSAGSAGFSTITTNDIGWVASIPASCNWLNLINKTGVNGERINFSTLSENSTSSARSVVITVATLRDPSKKATITVTQINNNSTGDIIIGTQLLNGPWGTAMGLTDPYNNSTSSPWTAVYTYPGGIYNPVPDYDGATANPWRGCKAYSELPNQSDRGKWRLSTWREVLAIQAYYPNSYWGAESYANDGGTGGTGAISSNFTGPAPYGSRSFVWLGRGNAGNYRCVRSKYNLQ